MLAIGIVAKTIPPVGRILIYGAIFLQDARHTTARNSCAIYLVVACIAFAFKNYN